MSRKIPTSQQTCSQPENVKISHENSDIANVAYSNPGIVWEENIGLNRPYEDHIGDELATSATPLQKWDGRGLVQVGHPTPVKRFVALNESGTRRIGEDHAGAKLTDAQVERIRDEYEAHPPGDPLHIGYRLLAKRWGVSKRTIRDIVSYSTRNQWAGRWKRVSP